MARPRIRDVFQEAVASLPAWLVRGVLIGLLGSLGAAGVFLVGMRAFPERSQPSADRVTGDRRRRDEIREYLTAIGEQFAENHPVDGRTVAFYLPERDVAITFDPRAFYRIDRTATHAVLVEHEMPGVNLGYRLPFETPDVDAGSARTGPAGNGAGTGPGDDPERHRSDRSRDARAAALDVLDAPPEATSEEVRSAYRRKVKTVHPDHGGDEEAFRRVREAYTVAKQHT